jgi:serine/threonine protein kinase
MVDFYEVKIIDTLGFGEIGTTYLAEYKNKKYALKIQHILEEDRFKDFSHEMWREIDLYEYINKLDKEEQIFFTKLYGYEIYNNCTHKQKREQELKGNSAFVNSLRKLDESNWCAKFLLKYKGDMTLLDFLGKENLSIKQIYSLMLQICKIIYTLYEAGYSHNDLHAKNIMVNKTDKEYFNFMNKKIPFYGYQLSAIDFGQVLHNKFGIDYTGNNQLFTIDREYFLFREMFFTSFRIIDTYSKNVYECKKLNMQIPIEKNPDINDYTIKQIFTHHRDFVNNIKNKYFDKFPAEKTFNILLDKLDSKKHKWKKIKYILQDITNENIMQREQSWNIIKRIFYEFDLLFPEIFAKYYGWCYNFDNPKKPVLKFSLPIEIVQELLLINNYKDYVEYLIKKLNE